MVPINNVSLLDIQNEFGGDAVNGIALTEYYKNGLYVPATQQASQYSIGVIPTEIMGPTNDPAGQEISIGMFRGLTKAFKYDFLITSSRYSSFNLKNELISVGWDGAVPIDVNVTIASGVYIVSQSTTIAALDATGPFATGSKLNIINNGTIYGRGGKGGKGGYFPNVNGENGGDGGDAISTTITTFITNNGVIAGGGGGGGGSGGVMYPYAVANGDNGITDPSGCFVYIGCSGGGGVPFGEAGTQQTTYSTDPAAINYTGEQLLAWYLTYTAPANSATLTERGAAGYMSEYVQWAPYAIGGFGGNPGSSGMSAHNIGYGMTTAGTSGSTSYMSIGGDGGKPGKIVAGGANVTWRKMGNVFGQVDIFGFYESAINPNATRRFIGVEQNKFFTVSEVYRALTKPTLINSSGTITEYTNNWYSGYGDILYSYSPTTNWTNKGQNTTITPSGSPLYMIEYTCVVENTSALAVYLEGIVDDELSYIMVNGVSTAMSQPAGVLNMFTPRATGSFTIPVGPNIISIGVRDNNNNSGSTYGNCHCINLFVKSAPYGQILVNPNQWFVKNVSNI